MVLHAFQSSLQKALELDIPYYRPSQSTGRESAVLALWGSDLGGEPCLLLTQRTESLETHKGQFAFPGGVADPDDWAQAGLKTTALRETEEEIGIPRDLVKSVGFLPEFQTGTGFRIAPLVGILAQPIAQVAITPNPAEIADVFWVGLSELCAAGIYRSEYYRVGEVSYPVDVFQLGDRRIWGATGAIIKNMLDRLRLLR